MLAYCRLIIREALRHGGSGWQEYDRTFWCQVAIDPHLPWHSLHPRPQFLVVGVPRVACSVQSAVRWIIRRPSVHLRWYSSGCLHLLGRRVSTAADQKTFVPHGIGGVALFRGHVCFGTCAAFAWGTIRRSAVHRLIGEGSPPEL